MAGAEVTDQVMLGLVDGAIPFVVTRVTVATFRCRIPVMPGGDGATTRPLAERTARCHHLTTLLVGQAPTCSHHLIAGVAVARGKDSGPLSVDLALLPWPLEPCP